MTLSCRLCSTRWFLPAPCAPTRRRHSGFFLFAALSAVVLLLAQTTCHVGAIVISGSLELNDCFAYVERFTFKDSSSDYAGYFQLNTSFPANMTQLAWVLFYSGDDSWDRVSNVDNPLSCKEKVAVAKQNFFRIVAQDYLYFPEGTIALNFKVLRFSNNYVRTFYLGMINTDRRCADSEPCDGTLANISYTGVFSQVEQVVSLDPGVADESSVQVDTVTNHASYDEFMLLSFYSVATVLSIAITGWSSYVAHKLWAQDKLHRVYQVLLLSIQALCCGIVCQLVHRAILQTGIHFGDFGQAVPIMDLEERMFDEGYLSVYESMLRVLPPGKGVPWLDQDSQYLFLFAEWLLLVQCMLISKGWAIVRRKIPPQGRLRLVLGMLIYLFCHVLLTGWLFNAYDPAVDVWFFGGTGCAIALILKVVILIWFIVSITHTRNKYLRKRRFFNKYLAVMGFYIGAVPLLQLILEFSLSFYLKHQVYAMVQSLSLLFIQAIHMGLYHPDTQCNKGFPFHADVKQMDATFSKQGDDSEGSKTLSLTGISDDGEVIDKIVSLRTDDFAMLEQYSLRIQERLLRLRQALRSCTDEYDDISFVEEDSMTALELLDDKDALRDDLTHGLVRTRKFQGFGTKKSLNQESSSGKDGEITQEEAEEWGAASIPSPKNATSGGTLELASTSAGTKRNEAAGVDLLTGLPVTRQRANALDTAAPQERAEVRKMKRAAQDKSERRQRGQRSATPPPDEGDDDNDEDEDVIVRRPSPKRTTDELLDVAVRRLWIKLQPVFLFFPLHCWVGCGGVAGHC
eukprot:INCI16345.1.p1 GENE.INCI16345.1~~INCI16345.1.p1  ORF type:complete len:797 (-),score=120.24 INCI16345.1:283-2673(-)